MPPKLFYHCKFSIFLARPECSAGSVVQQLAGAPGGEVRARCSVTAPSIHDAGPLRFYWTYNGTKDVLPVRLAIFQLGTFPSLGCFHEKLSKMINLYYHDMYSYFSYVTEK